MQIRPKQKNTAALVISIILIVILLSCLMFYLLWYLPHSSQPLSEPLDLSGTPQTEVQPASPSFLPRLVEQIKLFFNGLTGRAVCGNETQWTVLAVGIDYRGGDYLYGLADVIRVARIDFTNQQVNVAAIPRNLLIQQPPQRLDVTAPLLLNQSYFFGTPGMDYYQGSGYGAGALAATIQSNFDITAEHYVVVNFEAFVKFVDAIGGIEVDLPAPVDNLPTSFYPQGKQTLTGAQALELGRVREKYSDLQRIDNQTVILKGVLNKIKSPAILAKLPAIYRALKDSIVTDATPDQVSSLICLAGKLEAQDVQFFSPPQELLTPAMVYIPNLDAEMQVFQWDQGLVDWLHQSLQAAKP